MGVYRIAVFASGEGSNFQALAEAAIEGKLGGAEVALLVSDKPSAPVVGRAERLGIPAFLFNPKDYTSREAYEREIVKRLKENHIDLVVLAGYMRLLTPVIVGEYRGRLINIHPSLLPAFPGKDAIGQALAYGVKVSGVTVHFVDEGMDTGPIIAQRAIDIVSGETAESFAQAVHSVERGLYPEVVSWFAQRFVKLEGRQVTVSRSMGIMNR
ncbi:phosphoribosylglycinamide formyltransferase [Paenibacillus sp.]|jgi:phosphoribosylglycinamide formyltransferase-1|uniref:phosphoribosylglycinamide formyltransferase n=1 Tax=Paenibacillus sp. TaxID=58172 RepID=UPI00281F0C13|nr:phosphoribosylglycinamide formyltransferase [Paenibacillus sp.]MDR0267643.1 phosphoribosylglycinamide formyltransferase [Paenibacillus sp.]